MRLFCLFLIFRQGGAWSIDRLQAKSGNLNRFLLADEGNTKINTANRNIRTHPASFPLTGQRKRSKRNSLK